MEQSKLHSYIPGRKAGSMVGFPINSPGDLATLSKLGITFRPEHVNEMYKANQSGAAMLSGAMDSNLVAPQSVASIGTPIQMLQAWAPGFVQTITAKRVADELMGVATLGNWRDEEIVQGYSERSGNAQLYADNTNVPLTGWNTNFERYSIVRWEMGLMVGRLEEERAAAMNYSSAENKRTQASLALEVRRNQIAMSGFNNGLGRTYGFLNAPGLPAYINLPNGAAGTSTWATKTALEMIADFLSAVQALRIQSQSRIDPQSRPLTFAIAQSAYDFFAVPTQFGFSAKQWMSENYSNVRIISVPELDGANGGANVFYLYAEDFNEESTDDGRTFSQMVPAKFITIGAQQTVKGYVEDFGNATAGVMLKRAFAVVRRSGC